jgi:hypothetical protein
MITGAASSAGNRKFLFGCTKIGTSAPGFARSAS